MTRRRAQRVFPQRVVGAIESMIPGTVGGRVSNASPVVGGSSDVDASVQGGVATGGQGAGTDVFFRDRFVLAADGAQTVDLTYLPTDYSEHVYLNGIEQDEGTDWSRMNQTLSLLTSMAALTGDVVEVRYAYASDAPTPAVSTSLAYAGVLLDPELSWDVTRPATVGTRDAGVWTYQDVEPAAGSLPYVDIHDAYSTEATITVVAPDGGDDTHYILELEAAFSDGVNGTEPSGVTLQVNSHSGGAALYLRRSGAIVLSAVLPSYPVVGDTLKVVTDFSAHTATAYVNGALAASIDFSAETWYTPDGDQL